MVDNPPTFILITYTAASDLPFTLARTDIWLEFMDIFVTTNDTYFGDNSAQTAAIYANDIYTIPYPVNVRDVFFRNLGAGCNTVITITGTTLTRKKALEYGINIPP